MHFSVETKFNERLLSMTTSFLSTAALVKVFGILLSASSATSAFAEGPNALYQANVTQKATRVGSVSQVAIVNPGNLNNVDYQFTTAAEISSGGGTNRIAFDYNTLLNSGNIFDPVYNQKLNENRAAAFQEFMTRDHSGNFNVILGITRSRKFGIGYISASLASETKVYDKAANRLMSLAQFTDAVSNQKIKAMGTSSKLASDRLVKKSPSSGQSLVSGNDGSSSDASN